MSFGVVIPTLQRSPLLGDLLVALSAEPLVDQIVVVNNATTELPHSGPKISIISPGENIYVNPAWNAGVRAVSTPLLCIANDDLKFDTSLFHHARRWLRLPVGIVAPAENAFRGVERGLLRDNPPVTGRPRLRPAYRRTEGFGTLMFMRRSNYVEIPSELRICFGDDYLFNQQRHRNAVFSGFPIDTPMGTTSSSAEFVQLFDEDRERYLALPPGPYSSRYSWEPKIARHVVHRLRRARS